MTNRERQLETALRQIADLHAQSMGRPDAHYVVVAKAMGEVARNALLPSKANPLDEKGNHAD